MPHPAGFRVRIFSWVSSFFQRIDRDQTRLLFRIVRPTAPRPVLRMTDQFSSYRISVHVDQFFAHLLFGPHVEIVEAPLPKRWRFTFGSRKRKQRLSQRSEPFSAQRTRNFLFQNLQDLGRIPFRRFANEQMHVLGHNHITDQGKAVTRANLIEYADKTVSRSNSSQIRTPPET